MEPVSNNCTPSAVSKTANLAQNSPVQIQNQNTDLFKIGTALGLYDMQAALLAQEVLSQVNGERDNPKDRLPNQIKLTQMMVHKCLSHISSELFRQSFKNANSDTFYIPGMPLSYWAVYILRHTFGFSKEEIAFILKTSVLQVNRRLSKALECIYNH